MEATKNEPVGEGETALKKDEGAQKLNLRIIEEQIFFPELAIDINLAEVLKLDGNPGFRIEDSIGLRGDYEGIRRISIRVVGKNKSPVVATLVVNPRDNKLYLEYRKGTHIEDSGLRRASAISRMIRAASAGKIEEPDSPSLVSWAIRNKLSGFSLLKTQENGDIKRKLVLPDGQETEYSEFDPLDPRILSTMMEQYRKWREESGLNYFVTELIGNASQ